MDRRRFTTLVGAAAGYAGLGAAAAAAQPAWSFVADVAESCSCEIPCPCNFGRPTDLRCDGSRLIQIRSGNVGELSLAGVAFIATFEMRKWVKLYIDDRLDQTQMQAFDQILPLAFGGFSKLAVSRERVPLTVERSAETVRFTVPASTVEIKRVAGIDGKPIRVDGLPSPVFYDYVQYESVTHTHESADHAFSHSGTNGFTSTMRVSGTA